MGMFVRVGWLVRFFARRLLGFRGSLWIRHSHLHLLLYHLLIHPRVKGSHQQDWLDAIREGRPAGSDFDYGGSLTEIALLGIIAMQYPGKRLEWDAKAVKFTNHDAANSLVSPKWRPGWLAAG